MDGIGQRFVTFSNTYAATLSAAGASDTLDDVIATLDETTGPIVEEIDGLLTTLQTELVNVEDMIQEGAQGALDQIQAMNETVAGMKSDLKSFQDTQDIKLSRKAFPRGRLPKSSPERKKVLRRFSRGTAQREECFPRKGRNLPNIFRSRAKQLSQKNNFLKKVLYTEQRILGTKVVCTDFLAKDTLKRVL